MIYFDNDLHVKPPDSDQCFLPSSCHPFYGKNGIPYNRALRLKAIPRDAPLEKVNNQEKQSKITF